MAVGFRPAKWGQAVAGARGIVSSSSHRPRVARAVRAPSGGAQQQQPGGASPNGNGIGGGNGSDAPKPEDLVWAQLAFPFYMQGAPEQRGPCAEGSASPGASAGSRDGAGEQACVWEAIRAEATRDAAEEPLLSSFLYASILAHDSFERALAFVLSNRLASAVVLPTQLFEIFHGVLTAEPDVRAGALADVVACRERDPACRSYSQALLYYKGYHALQTHRIAHALWVRGQRVLAVALQSRVSEVLAVDIHPAARLGRGILLDHGTGVVIGETAVIGDNVSLLQNVTLGGTGKDVGDRHPKVSDGVLIGASATVLGNITIGRGAQIAAGSLVLKPVPPHTMVAGSPAKPVGKLYGNPALDMQQWSRKFSSDYDGSSSGGGGGGAPSSSSSGGGGGSNGVAQPVANGRAPAWANGHAHANGASPAKTPVTLHDSVVLPMASSSTSSTSSSSSTSTISSSRPTPTASSDGGAPAAAASPAVDAGSSSSGPAPLRGVHEGPVDATMDEDAAAALWPQREDPEYVI